MFRNLKKKTKKKFQLEKKVKILFYFLSAHMDFQNCPNEEEISRAQSMHMHVQTSGKTCSSITLLLIECN